MKLGKLLVIGIASLVFAPSSWALVGGPWDHLIKGTFSRANTDGLYEASITMKNGSGFLRFVSNTSRSTLADPVTSSTTGTANFFTSTQSSSNSTSGLAARSNAVVFYKGNAYYGSVYGTVNAAAKTVSGGGGGQSSVVDAVETSVQQFAQNINAFVNINGFSESMNITFTGRVVTQIPEVRFQARGQAIFFSRPDIDVNLVLPTIPPGGSLELTNVTELYEVSIAAGAGGGPIVPDDIVNMRLVGGRVNLATDYNTTPTTATAGAAGN
jgi:hypothetical protein